MGNKLNIDDLAKAAKTAIAMEEEGYSIYMKAAAKSNNPLGKATLKAIAEKELLHKKAIEDFYSGLTGTSVKKISFSAPQLWSSGLRSEILKSIRDSLDKLSGSDEDLLKAYEISMVMEKKGYDFYSTIAASAGDENAKQLFSFLAKEENSHYELLQETHLYLSDPSEWFHKEEKWLVEG